MGSPDRTARSLPISMSKGGHMKRIRNQIVTVIAGLGVAGLACAQGSQPQTAPGTVPVPKASSQPGLGTSTPTPAKPAAAKPVSKKPETISSTKQFAEHTGLARASEVIGLSVKDVAGKDAGKIEDLMLDAHGHVA